MSMWAGIRVGVGLTPAAVVPVALAAVALVVLGLGYKTKKLFVQLRDAADQMDARPALFARLLSKMVLEVQPLVEEMVALETQHSKLVMSVATLDVS